MVFELFLVSEPDAGGILESLTRRELVCHPLHPSLWQQLAWNCGRGPPGKTGAIQHWLAADKSSRELDLGSERADRCTHHGEWRNQPDVARSAVLTLGRARQRPPTSAVVT